MSQEKIRILVVEDNEMQRRLFSMLLESMIPGARVICACDGVDGLDKMLSGNSSYHVVISDVTMPKMDGLSMLEEARKSKVIPSCVILLTACQDVFCKNGMQERLRLIGVTRVFLKPVPSEEVVELILQHVV